MSKTLTLAELAASSTATKNPNTVEQSQTAADQATRKSTTVVEDPKNGAVPVSAKQVTDALIKSGKIKPQEQEIVEPPLVDDAFKSMNDRLQKSKDWINNEMMPIVRANAEEMALERQMNDIGVTEDATTSDKDIPSEDDIADMMASIDNDEAIEDTTSNYIPEERKYSNMKPNNNDTEEAQQPAKTVEKKVEVNESPVAKREEQQSTVVTAEEESENADLDALMKDLEAEDNMNVVDTEEETPEETRERFKSTMESVKIVNDPIDFNKFKIRRNAVDSSFVLNKIKSSRIVKKADWALYHTKKAVTFTECSGPELDTLRKNISNSNSMNGVIASIKFVYDHIEDANKPGFEAWCKLIRTEDIESLYFGIYKACYSASNLVARVCPTDGDNSKANCGKTSLIPAKIDEMIKYGSTEEDDPEKIKKEFVSIMNKDTTTENTSFESELMQISDDIVISYSPASLYSTFIQYSTLKSEITQKYADILNTMAYIDGFFSIDRESGELVPIAIKNYPTNINKTVLAKLNVYTGILRSLSNDQYNALIAKLDNIIQPPRIHYVYPKTKCPECGAEIAEEGIDSVLNLLFTRAQLAQIKSL